MDIGVLRDIWAVMPEGYVFLPRIHGWRTTEKGKLEAEKYIESRAVTTKEALEWLATVDPTSGSDQYFTPLTFKDPRRHKESVNPSRVLFADLDDCDPRKLPEDLRPTTYWQSSARHFQGIWLLDKELQPAEFEELNRRMSYAIGADKSGWDLTQILRVPGSYNYKRGMPDPCKLLVHTTKPVSVDVLRSKLAEIPSKTPMTTEWPIPKRALDLLNATECPVGERSERLWELEKLLIEANMPLAEIFRLLEPSGWNKFSERRDGSTALLKDIMKAEAEYKMARITTPKVSVLAPEAEGLTDFATLVTSDVPQPYFMVENCLVAESVGVCAGEPKTMKSTVVLDMAVSVASGKPFLGRYKVNETGPVLYIQEENSTADITHRLQRIALHHGVATANSGGISVAAIPLYIINNRGLNLTSDTDRDALDAMVRDNNIKLLILDPWYMMVAGVDEDKSKDVSPVLKFLTHLRNEYHCTVLLVHHFKKAQEVRSGQRMRGSSVFHAWVECGLYFKLDKGKEGEVIIDREFRSFSPRPDMHLSFSGENTGGYDVIVDEPKPTATAPSAPVATFSTVPSVRIAGLDEEALLIEIEAGASPEEVTTKYGVSLSDVDALLAEMRRTSKISGKRTATTSFKGVRICTRHGTATT